MNPTIESLHAMTRNVQLLLRLEQLYVRDPSFQPNPVLALNIQEISKELRNLSDMILFGLNTAGMPIAEVASLNLSDVDQAARSVENGRQYAARYVPKPPGTFQVGADRWGQTVMPAQIQTHARHSIADLGLSTRTNNILVRAGVYSINDLLAYTEFQLGKIPNLGKKAVDEIVHRLMLRRLELRKS